MTGAENRPEDTDAVAGRATDAESLDGVVEGRTLNVAPELDEDAFFRTEAGEATLVDRYDLEKAVPTERKPHLREVDRYWVNKPYAFVVIFHSTRENEKKYYVVEPHLTPVEREVKDFLAAKLRTSIKQTAGTEVVDDLDERAATIERATRSLLRRYGLFADESSTGGWLQRLLGRGRSNGDGVDVQSNGHADGRSNGHAGAQADGRGDGESDGRGDGESDGRGDGESDGRDDGQRERPTSRAARPEPAVLEEDAPTLTRYQVEKILYYLKRDFVGYERIDPIKHDISVEDISCDGYDSPVFVYHTDYENVITNVRHGHDELDDFVVKLAQRSGKGISKRQPQVDATLPDGSRAQLTLGKEVSDHGTNYTIRQFKDVPFTPVDLINWKTFSLGEMAFLWLCIENNKSVLFAGGTASGKTTSLNAVSLFIPSNSKIVSIEDTREVELPQRNWVASVTRPSFTEDNKGNVDEFDLLEASLRQRPEYILMGEVRGEEGRTLFQVMSTGHTTLTTFHADSVGEVIKRFTTDPINVSKTMFTALDLVSVQTQTRVRGRKVRRAKAVTEINHYDPENDEINVQDVYQWQAESDEFLQMGKSNTLEEVAFDRGWSTDRLETELFERKLVLAYLVEHGLNEYAQVAATLQAFINDPDAVLTLMANGQLDERLEGLRNMESVQIEAHAEKEEMVPRPTPDERTRAEVRGLLDDGSDLLAEYRGKQVAGLASALADVDVDVDVDQDADPGVAADGSGQTADAPETEWFDWVGDHRDGADAGNEQ